MKQEYNGSTLAYVIGSVDDEPIKLGSVYWSTELGIISFNHDEKEKTIGLGGWITGFDHYTIYYTILSVFFVSTWFILIHLFQGYAKDAEKKNHSLKNYSHEVKDRLTCKRIRRAIESGVRMFPITLWESFLHIIDQQVLKVGKSWKSNILIVFFSMGIFNLIFGYFLNQVSVDMVTVQPVDKIDTLSDLLDNPIFSNVRASCPGAGLYHEMALKNSIPQSLEHRLADKITKDGLWHEIKTNIEETGSSISELFEPFFDQKLVTVIDLQAIPASKSMMCQGFPAMNPDNLHMAKDWFGERLVTVMLSRGSQEEFIHHVRVKFRKLFESRVFHHLSTHAYQHVKINPSFSDFQILECIHGKGDKDQHLPPPFDAMFYIPLLNVCFLMLLFAILFLGIEHILWNVII